MINVCLVSWWIAYGMAIYCIASIYYYFKTRQIGTPFRDSLTKQQIAIKEKSSKIRKNIFLQGIAIGLVSMVLIRPFSTR